MRRAIWMALAFMGTAPLVALAQQNTGTAPAASPSGAGSVEQGQDTAATQAPWAPSQQSAGTVGTTQGQPATGGAGMQGTPVQGGQQVGAGGTETGGSGTAGPTYRGTPEQTPSAAPPVDITTRVGPAQGEQAGGAGAGTVGTGGMDLSAMRRELSMLRQRVASLEAEVDALRGTGGAGGGTGTTNTADIQVQGPVAVASAVFDGRVVDVTRKHIDIVDTSDGTFYRLTLDDKTRAFVGPDLKRIPVEQIPEGTPVRTSFALISGVEHARNIVTQPGQQQGSPQGQQEQAPQPPQQQRTPPQ
ncbi:hypothetical protein [Archangium lansingense]|uniref:DUF5666 domain-containing protein n=1 Tax=Archangium lansingense TaxID=2995310 RepID=A0ABT4APC0_9BACT|nr:hypothetical protein [Archangium lansinium]MCY1082999.1 hypothetical protein [Archangium lansinium]